MEARMTTTTPPKPLAEKLGRKLFDAFWERNHREALRWEDQPAPIKTMWTEIAQVGINALAKPYSATEEDIERAARAVAASHGYNPDTTIIPGPGALWKTYADDLHIALQSLSTLFLPTQAGGGEVLDALDELQAASGDLLHDLSDEPTEDQAIAELHLSRAIERARKILDGEVSDFGNVRKALGAVDAANHACPIQSRHLSPDRCPKCHATPEQNCGPNITALDGLERAVRAMIASSPALLQGGSNGS
jgi:hypothetical protein